MIESSYPTGPYKAGAEAISWRGLTGKWGRRWVGQVFETIRGYDYIWVCSHGHQLKREALACAQAWVTRKENEK